MLATGNGHGSFINFLCQLESCIIEKFSQQEILFGDFCGFIMKPAFKINPQGESWNFIMGKVIFTPAP